jgi:hydrogenase expression/formation protein HypE
MRELLEKVIVPTYKLNKLRGGVGLLEMDDGATIPLKDQTLVMSTDAYTIRPIFFPGGDLGKLAICGTINDLSVMGAEPLAMATSVVIEEGFPVNDLKRVINSMNEALEEVGIPLIAGDTKVMEKGKLDGMVISATGIGLAKALVLDGNLKPNDKLIVTGTIGDHETALLSFREGLSFETTLKSDVAPLWETVRVALKLGGVTAMKDPSRGGLAGALNDMARKSNVDVFINEASIPIKDEVKGLSEMLGIDPLEMTNEGVAIIGVKADKADATLEAVSETRYGRNASIIGEVKEGSGRVIMVTSVGGKRIVDEPLGSPIPRVC